MKETRYNPETKDHDMYLDCEYVGSAPTKPEADRRLDAMLFERLSHQR